MSPEQAAGSLQQLLLHHLSGRGEAPVDVVGHLDLVYGREFHPLYQPMEQQAATEYRLHGIDARSRKDVGEPAVVPVLLEGIRERPQDGVGVIEGGQALEFVNNEDDAVSPLLRQTERQAQDGGDIGRLQVPGEREHPSLGLVGNGVEDKVRPFQEAPAEVCELGRRGSGHAQERRAQPQHEILRRADVQGRELSHGEGNALHAQGIERLLDERGFPGLGGLAQHHVFSLGEQVPEKCHV